ncbi:hypothetical protein GCM10023081_23150 [Arthrobacter ginkgonis]|uniref:DUF2283 domain-containing protein n=1 Tax=Arthrobacter ginkgonis TaxID=1630594 RepID=A0ABP7CE37_9MICC
MRLRVEFDEEAGAAYVQVHHGMVSDSRELEPESAGGRAAVVADVDVRGRLVGVELAGEPDRIRALLANPAFWQELADTADEANEPSAEDFRRIEAALLERGFADLFSVRGRGGL